MKGFMLILLSILPLACHGTNTSFTWDNSRRTSAISSTQFGIGHYVAVGLGISTRETSSSLATNTNASDHASTGPAPSGASESSTLLIPTSDDVVRNNASVAPSEITSTRTLVLTTAAPTRTITMDAHLTTNTSNATGTTDCWSSWLDYWSTSSLNTPTYLTTGSKIDVETETESSIEYAHITTSHLESDISTYTYPVTRTISSDGYPVSVSVSYTTTTDSRIEWITDIIYSSLSAHRVTNTYSLGYFDRTVITLPPKALPTPTCQLPSIMPECSAKWSSFFNQYKNSDAAAWYGDYGTPECTQFSVTGAWCTSLRSLHLAEGTLLGQIGDAGWVTANGTSNFPASQTLANGCSLGCQACSITGESVQLYYWPPSTASTLANGTATAAVTQMARNDSSPRTVSIDGTILTSPTVYISYDILHASDSCGPIGKMYRNTIIPLLNTDHLFSLDSVNALGGYVVGFQTASFNFPDLVEPIPDSIYNRQARCVKSAVQWEAPVGHSDHMAPFSCARTAPYAPIIAVPPEARALDPAWASCGAWYGGLFDPPKALHPADAIATPALPATVTQPAANPEPTLDSGMPPQTSAPATRSSKPQTTQSEGVADPAHVAPTMSPGESAQDPGNNLPGVDTTAASAAGDTSHPLVSKTSDDPASDPSDGAGAVLSISSTQHTSAIAGENATPSSVAEGSYPAISRTSAGPPPDAPQDASSDTSNDPSNVPSNDPPNNPADDPPNNALSNALSNPSNDPSEVAGAILSMVLTQSHPAATQIGDSPMVTIGSDLPTHTDQGVVISAGSEVHTAIYSQETVFLDGAPLVSGHTVIVSGPTMSAQSGVLVVNGASQQSSVLEHKSTPQGVFTLDGQEHTAVQEGNSAVLIDGKSFAFGAVTEIGGSKITIATEGIIAGATPVPYAKPPAEDQQNTVFAVNEHTYSVDRQKGSILINGVPATIGSTVTTNGDVLTIGSNAIDVQGTTIPLPDGHAEVPYVTAGAEISIAQETMTAIKDGADVLITGTKFTLGQLATISGTRISVDSNGIVVGSSTATFHDLGSAAVRTGDAVPVSGPVDPASQSLELPTATVGADIIINGETMTALKAGADIDLAWQLLTMGQVTTILGSRISVASDGVVVGTSTAAFHDMGGSTATAGAAVTMHGTVYSASTLVGQPDAVLLAGQTLLEGGNAVTINGQVITNGPNGVSAVEPTSSATVTSANGPAETVLTIDGTAYTASPIPGKSGAFVLQGQTLSVGGSDATIADQLITMGSKGVSDVGSTSSSSGATTSPISSGDVLDISTTQQNSPEPSKESSASILSRGTGFNALTITILFTVLICL